MSLIRTILHPTDFPGRTASMQPEGILWHRLCEQPIFRRKMACDRGLGLSVAPARPVEYPLNPPAHD